MDDVEKGVSSMMKESAVFFVMKEERCVPWMMKKVGITHDERCVLRVIEKGLHHA